MFSGKTLSGSIVTASEKKPDLAEVLPLGRGEGNGWDSTVGDVGAKVVVRCAWQSVASDCPWLRSVVDYSDFVSYCFSNKGLRPEL